MNTINERKMEEIKKMSSKQLVVYAQETFGKTLNINNGRPWLEKKVLYLQMEKDNGGQLTGRAAERAKDLDKPEIVAKFKDEAKKIVEEGGGALKTTKKEKESKPSWDEDHFRIGSKGSEMFKALKKGVTLEKLDEIGGAAVNGFLAGIRRKVGEWPAGREVILEKYNHDKSIRITTYKTHEGKKVVLHTKEDKAA